MCGHSAHPPSGTSCVAVVARRWFDEVLGESFDGVLVSDFYAAYNHYPGLKQRCWVHLLRDIHELKALYPEDRGLVRWAGAVRQVYDRAKAYAQAGVSTSVRVPPVRISQPVDAGESTTVTVPPLLKRRDGASSKALPTHRAVHQKPAPYSIRGNCSSSYRTRTCRLRTTLPNGV